MSAAAEVTLDRGDVSTMLGVLADRLRVHGHAVRGMAAEQGGSAEGGEASALAADLGEVAATLDAVRAGLCQRCALLEVARTLRVG